MIGRAVGFGFSTARDFIARGLVRLRVTPDTLTLTGMFLTIAAGVCYALGAATPHLAWTLCVRGGGPDAYLLLAGGLLVLSSGCDMLDGAVARLANRKTVFGGFLDSTLDRYGDLAVYAGIALFFTRQNPGNLTYVLLCMLAVGNSFVISYTRARAHEAGGTCTVGYWQRGERMAAVLIATAAHNIPALVLQQALLTLPTVLRRIFHAKAVLEGKHPITDPRLGGWWLKIRLWRWPRMTLPYDFVTGLNIAWLIFGRVPANDYLRWWLG
jgi:CDP-diacylglycerol--glycerol-3-phosphate 3-phosphatidyltransferase